MGGGIACAWDHGHVMILVRMRTTYNHCLRENRLSRAQLEMQMAAKLAVGLQDAVVVNGITVHGEALDLPFSKLARGFSIPLW